ncbi:site-specific DNA-methyltransferase [Lachnoclostridium sp. An131]|uniref:DNA-methyltransferase n=1 Tax=Lachnoclostridium sp. An131 TaxID=1965555 RepID=UPI000B37E116|nr:site-specific DNA-methyltransferase [Lachnoclostridium sp. An131]OUQ27344.1 site-specific DNA-methyltransferase [Lachnoclostridium sp. An131]
MNRVELGDSIELIKNVEDESVHLIISDIPYGINYEAWDVIHKNTNCGLLGKSPAQEKSGNIFKSRGKPLNGWSQADKNIPLEYYEWCKRWSGDWYRVLKPGASCFVFAGRRLAHRCICALEDEGFIFKDMLAWEKDSAAYRAQRVSCVFDRRNDEENSKRWEGWKIGNLRPLFEPVLWFMKPYPQGSTLTDNILKFNLGAFNEWKLKEMTELNDGLEKCSNILKVRTQKSDRGLHPTQKAVRLMEILISMVTIEGQVVMDPFCGCGTTLVAAKNLNREYIGFEINQEYYKSIIQRLES